MKLFLQHAQLTGANTVAHMSAERSPYPGTKFLLQFTSKAKGGKPRKEMASAESGTDDRNMRGGTVVGLTGSGRRRPASRSGSGGATTRRRAGGAATAGARRTGRGRPEGRGGGSAPGWGRSEEHTSELQSR